MAWAPGCAWSSRWVRMPTRAPARRWSGPRKRISPVLRQRRSSRVRPLGGRSRRGLDPVEPARLTAEDGGGEDVEDAVGAAPDASTRGKWRATPFRDGDRAVLGDEGELSSRHRRQRQQQPRKPHAGSSPPNGLHAEPDYLLNAVSSHPAGISRLTLSCCHSRCAPVTVAQVCAPHGDCQTPISGGSPRGINSLCALNAPSSNSRLEALRDASGSPRDVPVCGWPWCPQPR